MFTASALLAGLPARRRSPTWRTCRPRSAPSPPASSWRSPSSATSCRSTSSPSRACCSASSSCRSAWPPTSASPWPSPAASPQPWPMLMVVKIVVAFALERMRESNLGRCWRFAVTLPQGSEFGFVLFGAALEAKVLGKPVLDRATLVVALTMAVSPLLFALSERFVMPRLAATRARRVETDRRRSRARGDRRLRPRRPDRRPRAQDPQDPLQRARRRSLTKSTPSGASARRPSSAIPPALSCCARSAWRRPGSSWWR